MLSTTPSFTLLLPKSQFSRCCCEVKAAPFSFFLQGCFSILLEADPGA